MALSSPCPLPPQTLCTPCLLVIFMLLTVFMPLAFYTSLSSLHYSLSSCPSPFTPLTIFMLSPYEICNRLLTEEGDLIQYQDTSECHQLDASILMHSSNLLMLVPLTPDEGAGLLLSRWAIFFYCICPSCPSPSLPPSPPCTTCYSIISSPFVICHFYPSYCLPHRLLIALLSTLWKYQAHVSLFCDSSQGTLFVFVLLAAPLSFSHSHAHRGC